MANQLKEAWLDVETTGFTPEGNLLLEVASEVYRQGTKPCGAIHFYIDHPLEDVKAVLEKDDYVRRMHEESGLLEIFRTRPAGAVFKTLEEAEDLLASFWEEHNGGERKNLRIAGNSVYFDKGWIESRLPRALEQVHYRLLDVSALRLDCEAQAAALGLERNFEFPKTKHHRALDDLNESRAEYAWLKAQRDDLALVRHQRIAARTVPAPGETPEKVNIQRLVLAGSLAEEAGEVFGHLKKMIGHGHDFDRSKFIEELGDNQWYANALCTAFGITMDEVMRANHAKLSERYPEGFSEEASRNRKS